MKECQWWEYGNWVLHWAINNWSTVYYWCASGKKERERLRVRVKSNVDHVRCSGHQSWWESSGDSPPKRLATYGSLSIARWTHQENRHACPPACLPLLTTSISRQEFLANCYFPTEAYNFWLECCQFVYIARPQRRRKKTENRNTFQKLMLDVS